MIRLLVVLGFCIATGCDRGKPPVATVGPVDAKAVEENNRGVGLMGQFEFDKAIPVFQGLLRERPRWDEVNVNLAIAYLNRQQEGDSQRAMSILEEIVGRWPGMLQARYCRAILLLNAGKPAEALVDFQFVTEKDPSDADAQCYLGQGLFSWQKVLHAMKAC